MKFFFLPVFAGILFLLPFSALAQDGPEDHHHDHHLWHVGFGVAGTHLVGEQGVVPGYHLHLTRQLGEHHQWGAGLGWEMIPGSHRHNGLNLLVSSRLLPFLSLSAGPGVVIGRHDGHTEILPAFHTELVTEINLWGVHIGPMAGFGIDREDRHFSLGIHLGLGF